MSLRVRLRRFWIRNLVGGCHDHDEGIQRLGCQGCLDELAAGL